MKLHCHIITLFILITLCIPLRADELSTTPDAVQAPQTTGSLWSGQTQSMFIAKPYGVGDLLTVIINQQSSSITSANHVTKKDFEASANPGTGWLDFIKGLGAKADRSTSGAGNAATSTTLVDRLTVAVTKVLPNGNLAIEGTRTIKLECDETLLTFLGEVNPNDIEPERIVMSEQVANQRMTAKGMGPIAEKQRPGFLSRVLSFLW